MKAGDLVKWTHPHVHSTGIILEIREKTWMGPQANIYWFDDPKTSGLYPIDHEYLELLSENR